MTIEIRPAEEHELRDACDVLCAVLLAPRPDDAAWERARPSYLECDDVGAFDDGTCVGYAATFTTDTVVPGGRRLPTAAVTRVGVLPTHRRRGVLTAMISRLLAGSRERGHVLASLRASEARIYGRYGFGVAGHHAVAELSAAAARPIHDPAGGSMRKLRHHQIHEVVTDLHARVGRRRVGSIARTLPTHRRLLRPAIDAGGAAAHVVVHLADDGEIDGYVHYEVRWHDADDPTSSADGTVHELIGADDAVERALWAFVCDVDLVARWSLPFRPVDDPLRWAVADTRAYVARRVVDEQWLRLLDVDAALRARTYLPGGAITIEVRHDGQFADHAGRWSIGVTGEVRRTEAPPDLVVDVDVLGAAYLGGTSWHELAAAGRVDVPGGDDALVTADSRFAHRPQPFCGTHF